MAINNVIRTVYAILLAVAVVIVAAGFAYGKTGFYDTTEGQIKEIQPTKTESPSEMEREFTFDLSGYTSQQSETIQFFTNHQFVDVYADGVKIYSLYEVNSIYGNTPGSYINFVEIPTNTKTLVVDTRAAFESVVDRNYTFYMGNGIGMFISYIKSSIPNVILTFMLILVGMVLIIFDIAFRKKANLGVEALYFGIGILLIATWCLIETDFMSLIVRNKTMLSFMGYITLTAIPIPTVQFLRKHYTLKDQWICRCICIYAMAVGCITTGLHMFGIVPYRSSSIFIHIGLALSILYMVYAIYDHVTSFGWDKMIRNNIIAIVIFSVSILLDLYAYNQGMQQTDVIAKVGILIYTLIMSYEVLQTYAQKIENGKNVERYKEMATKDMMTGMFNRSAYDEWETKEDHQKLDDLMLVAFDLNELKKCNDTYGHTAGDRYIIDAASIISSVFTNAGSAYRLGGDEFIVVIGHSSDIKITKYLELLDRKVKEYNRLNNDFHMGIAYGYAVKKKNDSIKETREIADERMYKKKAMMKS